MTDQLALLNAGARFDAMRAYRYTLWRRWSAGPAVCWIMLNPSTADETALDPTVRKCIGFAKRWEYGGIVVVNLFAFRATDPRMMKAERDPVGVANDEAIVFEASRAGLVVAAWGVHGAHLGRAAHVVEMLRGVGVPLRRLGAPTKDGHPRHPLYVSYDTIIEPADLGGEP